MFRKLVLPKETQISFNAARNNFVIRGSDYEALKTANSRLNAACRDRLSHSRSIFPEYSHLNFENGLDEWIKPNPIRLHIAHVVVGHLKPVVLSGQIPKVPRDGVAICERDFIFDIPVFELRLFLKLKQMDAILEVRKFATSLLEKESGEDPFSQQSILSLLRTIKLVDSWFHNPTSLSSRFMPFYSQTSINLTARELHEFNLVPPYCIRNGMPNITNLEQSEFRPLISLEEYDY